MPLKKFLVLVGALVVLTAILAACGAKPTETPLEVPFKDAYTSSGHADAAAEAFNHWNDEDPAEIPTSCANCHSAAGYLDYLQDGKVDTAVPAPAGTITCITCHNDAAKNLTNVTFPSGVTLTGLGSEARCIACHQGRESKVSVDETIAKFNAAETPDVVPAPITGQDGKPQSLGFINIHYFAAAVTLYGSEVHGGYEYDGKVYDVKHDHVEDLNTCIGCHDPHTLEIRFEKCATCHGEQAKSVEELKNVRVKQASGLDYDGDGNTDEGMYYEIQGLQEILYAQIQRYAKETAGKPIVYDANAYPYFFIDTNDNGTVDEGEAVFSNRYDTWTTRLLKAAYNYQVSVKDPGAFAHGSKYIIQLLYDSIEDLGGDVSALNRDDAGHFAGNTMPFRDWDEAGVVPYRCVKCHTAEGLPTFIQGGGTTIVTSNGTTLTAGVDPMSPSNGFQCITCHDEANWPNRYAVASVVFPSGKTVSYGGRDADGKFVADDSNLCILCHQGRESTTSVNNALRGKDPDTVDPSISFKNIHYFAAGATIFGNEVQGAYQFEGKEYVGMSAHPVNKCIDCHDAHALEPKVESCATCHQGAKPEDIRMTSPDYDGDGATEGVLGEIETLSDALYAEIQRYAEAKGTPIVYDPYAYPYFFVDMDKDGKPDKNDQGRSIAYNAWTPTLLRAAYNYQYIMKDAGGFGHNPKYIVQILIDSIEALGGDVTAYIRP